MKKIYLFLTFLLSFLGGSVSSAVAQSSYDYEIDDATPLIEDASLFSSPYSENDLGKEDGGNLSDGVLIDGDASTYWHSYWGGGAVENGTHYLQVEMPEGEYELIAFRFTRRNVSNDHIILWSVYGTNDFDAAKEDCEKLAEISTPFTSSSETITSSAFNPNGYQYLRFYQEENTPYNGVSRGYFHLAEFQLYPAIKLDDFEAALNELTAVCDYYYDKLGTLSPGTQPGQYSEEAFNTLDNLITQGYGAEDGYTAAQLKELSQQIKDAYEKLLATFVPFTSATIPDGYYRIRSGMQYTNTIDDEVIDCYKYLYTKTETDGTINARWQTPADLSSDGSALWKITNVDGLFDIVSAATDARFNDIAQSTQVTLSTESQNLMAIEPLWSDIYEQPFANIRVSTQEGGTGKRVYIHQNSHGNGTGVSSNIVGWEPTMDKGEPKASEWVLEPVSDEEAQAVLIAYEPVKNHDALVEQYKEILNDAKAKLTIAIDEKNVKLITSASQFSSPWTEPTEGSVNNLLDGNTSTFWHSNWSDGNTEQHLHYLQVDLGEPVYGLYSYSFSRRSGASSDHTTQWSIYGSATEDDDSFEELFTWETPYGSNTESFTSEPFEFSGSRYIRIYSDATTNNRGFWHVSEVQFGKLEDNPSSQFVALGSIATDLQSIIEAEIADADLTVDDFNTLKAAYDAFIDRFVDPAALRAAIDKANTTAAAIVVGTEPGYWTAESNAGAYKTTIEQAKAYDAAGAYTAEQSEAFISALENGADDIFGSAISIQEGKWYRIRFGTEEEYDEYGLDKVAGNGSTKTESLFGKSITVADFSTDEEGYEIHEGSDKELVGLGHQLYLDDTEDIYDKDLSLFRFVNVGDSAYALQNKATGMFIKAGGATGAVSLSVHPSLFNVRAIGYGQNTLHAKTLTGENQNYLHCQVSQNVIVTWGPDFEPYAGSRSSLYIEEVEDVASDYAGTAFNINLQPASISAFCFPVEVSAESGMYGVARVEDSEVVLVKLEKAAAGRPFIVIADGDSYDPEAEEEPYTFAHGYSFVNAASSEHLLKGTYAAKTVGAGVIVPQEDGFVVTKNENASVAANHAWIQADEAFDTEAELSYVISNEADGIAAALNAVSRKGAIYTVDGRFVGNGNLNSLRQKGTYILNDTKVIVK